MRDSVRVLVEECGARLDQVRLGRAEGDGDDDVCDMCQLLNGDTSPLYLAAQRGYTELAVQLLGYGADVNFVMPRGEARGDIIAVGGPQQGGRGRGYRGDVQLCRPRPLTCTVLYCTVLCRPRPLPGQEHGGG